MHLAFRLLRDDADRSVALDTGVDGLAEFACEGTLVVLKGAVIVEGKANSMALTVTLKAAQSKGVQKWTHFVAGKANEDTLEAKVGAGSFEQSGLALTTIQTNAEKVEANTVVG